jgi:ActR/RegA family two-component response regulator
MRHNVIAAVDDIFFAAKIRAVAEHLGVDVRFAKSAGAVIEAARANEGSIVVVDLHSQKCQPLELARRLKADANPYAVTLIGFFSHVETALQAAAEEAGYDRVIPRSAFTKNLGQILTGES